MQERKNERTELFKRQLQMFGNAGSDHSSMTIGAISTVNTSELLMCQYFSAIIAVNVSVL